MQSDSNFDLRNSLVQNFHQSPIKLVLALSGGGSLSVSDLLTVPGGSRTVLEVSVPYSQVSLQDYIGRIPDKFCCERTARHLAMTAFSRGCRCLEAQKMACSSFSDTLVHRRSLDLSHDDGDHTSAFALPNKTQERRGFSGVVDSAFELDDCVHLIGIGCTASLATDREKRGEYRVHVAAQTLRRTIAFSLSLTKDARTRWEEERLLGDLILNVIETVRWEQGLGLTPQESTTPPANQSEKDLKEIAWSTFGNGTTNDYRLHEALPLMLKEGEQLQGRQAVGAPPLVDLFFGKIWAVLWESGEIVHFRFRNDLPTSQAAVYNPQAEYTQAIFPGSFNPIHCGHLEMIDIAEKRLGNQVSLEISVQNVDKPSLDYIELEDRLTQIEQTKPGQAVWLTQTHLFEEKSELFQEATFIVGADTLQRFAELRFYHESIHQLQDVLRVIAYHNCRFLVFARQLEDGFESLQTLRIPDMLRSLADEVDGAEFLVNISSRELRKKDP